MKLYYELFKVKRFGSKVGLKSRFSGFSASLNLDSWDGVNPEL